MRLDSRVFYIFSSILVAYASPAWAANPKTWFDEGLSEDIAGQTHSAFESYLQAAKAGLPEAEFNVAAMLDSGRGVTGDISQAAMWYARAASHGNQRAAYNMGQLYEKGLGVPQNIRIARAWFEASGLGAGKARLAALRPPPDYIGPLSTPVPIGPISGTKYDPIVGGVELVWTCAPQPEPVQYYVELREIGPGMSREIFSQFTNLSSVFVQRSTMSGGYAWRVLAVAGKTGRYQPSDWQTFHVSSNSNKV